MLAREYAHLMRLDKPVPLLLLLWPTLWALWLANKGTPPLKILIIFSLGVVLMRSAGCIINDAADRHIDKNVQRTKDRPLASGKINLFSAVWLALFLGGLAFLLVLQCNTLTIQLAFAGAALALIYPFLKRMTHLPQAGLGLAFSWGVPMAFAAETNSVHASAWFLFFTCALWPIIYDTMYAMADREDDIKIGVKSTAILFAGHDKHIIGLLQIVFIMLLIITGKLFNLERIYYVSVAVAALLFVYQQALIKDRDRQKCLNAFLHNHWIGLVIFAGIVLSLLS